MWRNWVTDPPQIPHVPIEIAHADCKNTVVTTLREMSLAAEWSKLQWRPTGIYREEFWQTTGRWL